jgi:Tyrosine phosphatase family
MPAKILSTCKVLNLILSYHHLGRRYLACPALLSCLSLRLTIFTLDMSELAPVDPDLLSDVLSKHPFVTIDGIFNVRDLGMIPVADSEYVTRSGFMYRSGELSGVTLHGVYHIPL